MTKRRRETTDDEKVLFRESFRDVRPLDLPAGAKPGAGKPKTRSESGRAPPRPQTGLDGRTGERLRRGQLEPESRLDLHGMTEMAAHRALIRFVQSAQAQGLRLVLVITGKGAATIADDAPFDLELVQRTRGVLKSMVPRWLEEPELARRVADVRAAHRRHGGAGALYVYLRKR
jgi:DNA-nicking Smr family endonuclease